MDVGASAITLRGGLVVDGSGNAAQRLDVRVHRGRITEIGQIKSRGEGETLDISGLTLTPGFIDMHSHSDLALASGAGLEAKVSQGITTEVLGQDGFGYAPVPDEKTLIEMIRLAAGINGAPDNIGGWRSLHDFHRVLAARGLPTNTAVLAPHHLVRLAVIGMEDRAATVREIGLMCQLVTSAMSDGALGLSTGLTYAPGRWAPASELVALCRAIRPQQGIYVTHLRDYDKGLGASLEEALAIGAEAMVPVHLSHFHVSGKGRGGLAENFLSRIREARRQGHRVTLDAYPYTVANTYLMALLPSWAQVGGPDETLERLRSSGARREIEAHVTESSPTVGGDWSQLTVAPHPDIPSHLTGQSIAHASTALGVTAGWLVCEALVCSLLGAVMLIFSGHDENVASIARDGGYTVGSDGLVALASGHPRAWGTFPRVFANLVRDQRVLGLEQAVAACTGRPANILGLVDRGFVRKNLAADLIVFDAESIKDHASFQAPQATSTGIEFAFVNGVPTIWRGALTGNRAGLTLGHRSQA